MKEIELGDSASQKKEAGQVELDLRYLESAVENALNVVIKKLGERTLSIRVPGLEESGEADRNKSKPKCDLANRIEAVKDSVLSSVEAIERIIDGMEI